MRRTPQPRPNSRDAAVATTTTTTPPIQVPVKKVFNCIVDETALLAGAKKSTRDGIRKWITNGQIRLFVPLHTLNQATRLKDKGSGRVSSDAEEALFWLDDATSNAPHLVTLQGGYEKFENWADVEKFALPKPLFSEEDIEEYDDEVDQVNEHVDSKLSSSAEALDKHLSTSSIESDVSGSGSVDSLHSFHSAMSPLSPPESPIKSAAKPHSQNSHRAGSRGVSLDSPVTKSSQTNSSNSGVPSHLRSLFNYILWRVQQEIDPAAALESFIFLCDDPLKAKLAQRFGIRVKSLADIRYVVAREEREFRNRQVVQRKENEKAAAVNGTASRPSTRGAAAVVAQPVLQEKEESDDEDVVVFKRPPKAPAAMIAAQEKQSPRLSNKVLDPNQFSRSPAGRGNARGASTRGGAGHKSGRGGGSSSTLPIRDGSIRGSLTPATNGNTGPIDPDSFNRPAPNGGRGRGGSRRLFIPT